MPDARRMWRALQTSVMRCCTSCGWKLAVLLTHTHARTHTRAHAHAHTRTIDVTYLIGSCPPTALPVYAWDCQPKYPRAKMPRRGDVARRNKHPFELVEKAAKGILCTTLAVAIQTLKTIALTLLRHGIGLVHPLAHPPLQWELLLAAWANTK